jgi:hypothetical protein
MIKARLSFNTNVWVKPSGLAGKSKSKSTFEFNNGFGFEEWLFNNSFSFIDENGDKWHFGYIEGIHKNYKPGDENNELQLFTIDARTKYRYDVAKINKWKAISQIESSTIISRHPHLIAQMRIDLAIVNNNNALPEFKKHFHNIGNCQLFNIIYRDLTYLFDLMNPLPRNNRIYKLHRFFLYR